MKPWINITLTAVIAALAAAAPVVAAAYPQVGVALGGLAAAVKFVDGLLTPGVKS